MLKCFWSRRDGRSMRSALVWSGVAALAAIGLMVTLSRLEQPLAAPVTTAVPEGEATASVPDYELSSEQIVAQYREVKIEAPSPLRVEWFSAKSTVSADLLELMLRGSDRASNIGQPVFERARASVHRAYAVGSIKDVGQLYVMESSLESDGPGPDSVLYYFVWGEGRRPVLLNALAPVSTMAFAASFDLDRQTTVADLDNPETVKTPSGRSTFRRDTGYGFSTRFFIEDYQEPKLLFTTGDGRRLFTSGDCFMMEGLDFVVDSYALDVSPLAPATRDVTIVQPPVHFLDGSVNQDNYSAVSPDTRACSGSSACLDAVDEPLDMKSVKLAGRLPNASPVYEATLEGAYAADLQEMYGQWQTNSSYASSGDNTASTPTSTEDFMKLHPLLFWKDSLGEWVRLRNVEAQMMAECGKPVIYLYPERDTVASVRVAPTGGLTKTEPAYGDGWRVLARPDGRLSDLKGGQDWPYLFWEGLALNYRRPEEGFVVAREQVDTFLAASLTKLGLTAREAADFREFWTPRLQDKPFYFVTFVPQATFEKMAPLVVEPAPTTVIRVFMDYEPLDAPINVRPQRLAAPERRGFTVVEWGGQLHR